ncbi:hypothetical protein BACPU_05610 [Bacillus pumilus]|nr:hypothetical protein BACPU_05610 [Bacillus pumilus]
MKNLMLNRLKDMQHEISGDIICPPFCFITGDGKPFYSWVFTGNKVFETCFFSLISINEENNCVLLELLVPCFKNFHLCQKGLYRSNSCVLVDISLFCGISEVELPVFDYIILEHIEKYPVLCCFSTSSCSLELWRNGTRSMNTATVVLHHQDEQDSPISINIQTKKSLHTLCVEKGESRAITVKDVNSIMKNDSKHKIRALLELQLNLIQREKINFRI